MKKTLSLFAILLILINMLPFYAFAKEDTYYRVGIPIFQGTTENISSEILNGITSTNYEKENIIFVKIEDFLRLSKAQKLSESENSIKLCKNTICLEAFLNNKYALLSLGYSEDKIFKTNEVYVPCIKYKNEYYISLTHSLNAFGINMGIINKQNFSDLISVDNKLFNKDNTEKAVSCLIEKGRFNFLNYPNYLLISCSEPFDKFYIEYRNNYSDYQFSWNTLPWYLNDITASAISVGSYYLNEYKGMTDFVIGDYDSEKRYYDILLEIINNESSEKSTDISSILSLDSNLKDEIIDIMGSANIINDSESFIFFSINDTLKASEKAVQLALCSEFQKNIIPNTLLNSDKLKNELIDDKITTDLLRLPIFGKYMIKTYESAIFNNQYALFKSSENAQKNISEPLKNLNTDNLQDIIYNGITTITDKGLEEISGGATKIPDLLMKNIKYVPGMDSLLSTSEKLGKVKDCYFIQETLKNLCSKEFFEETQNEYYNVRFILQSSLTAYELLLDSGAVIKPDDKQFIEQKCNKISDMISNLKACNINFYSTNMESNNLKNLNELFIHNNSDEKSTTITPIEPTPQITAIDLIDKSIPEIISLMNGEYQIIQTEMGGYYNGTYNGIFYIQNQSVFPGMEFYVETLLNESIDFKGGQSTGEEIQSDELRRNLEAGKYALDVIQVNKSGKATDSISADMDYIECSKALGNFDCIQGNGGYIGGSPLSALYTYNEKSAKIELHFIATSEMFNAFRLSENNKLSSEQMKSFNPSIMNVVIRKAETVTTNATEPPTESPTELPTETQTEPTSELKIETGKLSDSDIKSEWQHVLSLDFEYPIFTTSDNSLKDFLDTSITNEILSYMATDSDYNLFISGGFEYDMSIDGYLSIDGWINNHPEGGQGYLGCENYTFFVDLKNRKVLSLKDLFSESEDLIYNEIQEKANNYSDKNVVWESSLSNYDYENCKFLLNKDKLTLIFSPYEVSTGVAGTVEIEIPVSDINLTCVILGVATNGF